MKRRKNIWSFEPSEEVQLSVDMSELKEGKYIERGETLLEGGHPGLGSKREGPLKPWEAPAAGRVCTGDSEAQLTWEP